MPWQSAIVMTNGIQTHIQRSGGDKPALVIAHGITDNAQTWIRNAQQLKADFDVIVYDQRGHGRSAAPDHGYTFNDYAADLTDLIRALNLKQVSLLGHSGGAVIATLLAAQQPTLVNSLILEDPAWGTAWGEWDTAKAGIADWFRGVKKMTAPELTAQCRESNPSWLEEDVTNWVTSKLQVHPNVMRLLDQPAPAWRTAIAQVTCPVLLVTGDVEKGALNTPADAAAFTVACPHAQTVHIAGAGHTIHHDRFEVYTAVVTKFLAAN